MSQCGLRTHPDANDDTTIEWADSKIGKAILAAGDGKGGIEMRMRWDAASKQLVPLERLVADEILKAVPPRDTRLGEITYVHTMSATLDSYGTEPATYGSNRGTKPPCCVNYNGTEGKELLIPGLLHFATSQIPVLVLIDTGCMQTNVVSARVAATIKKAGGVIQKASVTLTSGVVGQSYGVEGIMNVNISLTSSKLEARKDMCLRVLVCKDVTTDLIIGLPSIKHFNLLPILNDHISTIPCCEICSNNEAGSQSRPRDRHGDREKEEAVATRQGTSNRARYTAYRRTTLYLRNTLATQEKWRHSSQKSTLSRTTSPHLRTATQTN